jgi:hypothetical protein
MLLALAFAAASAIPSTLGPPTVVAPFAFVASAATASKPPAPLGFAASSPLGGAHRDPRVAGQGPVTYHGGPVQHSSAAWPIFWAPAGYSFPANYQSLISQYFSDVARESFQPSNVYGSIVQYFETNPKRFVSYNVVSRGAATDTNPFPPSGCPNYPLGDGKTSTVCLTRAQIQKEIAKLVASRNLPTGLGNQVFLFTPQGVASCTSSTALKSGGCYDPMQYNGYCAFHARIGSGDQVVLYANMPYDALPGCSSGQSPNGNPADAVLNNVAHEHNETMTDPLGTGWYDATGQEIADKCHLQFGKALGTTASGKYNQLINGHRYWLQMLWSNRARACVPRNAFPQPIVSFTYTPSSPKPGRKVTFISHVREAGESKWTYRWTFPDGGTSTAADPTHVFKTYVFAGDVVLVVTDTRGDQTRYSRIMSVG